MSETTIQNLIDAINHNADLLEKHLAEGVYVHRQSKPSKVWAVNHKLGSLRPLIETYDMAGDARRQGLLGRDGETGRNHGDNSHTIDFLIAAADLPLVPAVGDMIVSGNIVHEVIDLGGDGCWTWCDPHGIRRRIHTSIFKEQ